MKENRRAALHDLGDAVDRDDAFFELAFAPALFRCSHSQNSRPRRGRRRPRGGRDRGTGSRRGRTRRCRSRPPWPARRGGADVARRPRRWPSTRRACWPHGRRRRGERVAGDVVDQLRVDVLVRAEHRQARRAAVPVTFLRTRRCRRARCSVLLVCPVSPPSLVGALTCRSYPPCATPSRRRSGRPCPCRAPACGSCGCRRPPGRRAACRCP